MLSNTKGFSSHSPVQGFHKDIQSKQGVLCPELKRRGRCKSYERECAIREQVAREKEAELRKKALAMYALQMDLLADREADGVDPELAKMRQLLMSGASDGSGTTTTTGKPTKAAKAAVVEKLVMELKQEPEYVHWNLEGDVAERMVQQQVRSCRFSHRVEALQSLKRARNASTVEAQRLLSKEQEEEAGDRQEQRQGSAVPSTAAAAVGEEPGEARGHQAKQHAFFAEERARVFASFTPLQRCVVAMMWQRNVSVPQYVICANVRHKVEEDAKAELQAKANGADVEEALEDLLDSSGFEARVKAAENAVVTKEIFHPAFGVLDLASLPQLVAYLSKRMHGLPSHGKAAPAASLPLTEATLHYFGSSTPQLFAVAKSATSTAMRRVLLTEKELDLSSPPRAAELVEAIEWAIHVYNTERRLSPFSPPTSTSTSAGSIPADSELMHTKLSYRAGRVTLLSLCLRNCQMTLADGLVASLHKSGLGATLLALDLSDNRLHSLRFLFALRAHFAERLLRLSLKNNLITRKPEYQEQVRKSLPRLTSLDGEPIRRPPLRFPKAHATSYTALNLVPDRSAADAGKGGHQLTQGEYDLVMDTVARLFYIWETHRIPHTELELRAFLGKTGRGTHHSRRDNAASARERGFPRIAGDGDEEEGNEEESDEDDKAEALLPEEEEVNEDNFPHRYLHPSATFTFTASPGTTFFTADSVKLDREVEFDDAFAGMRLNAHDMKDARVFDVAVRNSSRNLLAGRPALQRFGRGCDNCYLAYQYSLYPDRFEVDHGLPGAVVSVTKLPLVSGSEEGAAGQKGFGTGPVGGGRMKSTKGQRERGRPGLFVVNLHGVMTWRLPSMRHTQCFSAAYDRTMVLTEKMLAVQNFAWERRRSPKLVLCNDHILLRPIESEAADKQSMPTTPGRATVVFAAATAARVARLVVQFGLEACRDGEALVRAVMEHTTSDAAEEAALDALVFGPPPPPPPPPPGPGVVGSENTAVQAAADAAIRAVLTRHLTRVVVGAVEGSQTQRPHHRHHHQRLGPATETTYKVFSLLDRPIAPTADTEPQPTAHAGTPAKWGGSTLHDVPLSLLVDVTRTLNEHYELRAFSDRRPTSPADAGAATRGV